MVPIDGGVTGDSCRPIERQWRPAGWEVRQLLTFAYGVENVSRLVVGWCFGYGSMLLTSFSRCFVHSCPELFTTFGAYCCPRQTLGRKEQKVVLFTLRKTCCWCRDWRPSEPYIYRETVVLFTLLPGTPFECWSSTVASGRGNHPRTQTFLTSIPLLWNKMRTDYFLSLINYVTKTDSSPHESVVLRVSDYTAHLQTSHETV